MPSITIPKLDSQTFLSSGSFVPQPGVYEVLLVGCGGGSGGQAGNVGGAGGPARGGQGAPNGSALVAVTPGVTYTVTIGAGGAGGSGSDGANGADGGSTTFAA